MIDILTTGGTIEGLDYDSENKEPIGRGISIEELLAQSTVCIEYVIKRLFSKDSRFITEKDRELLFNTIKALPTHKVLITHGTYTMVETAQYLGKFNFDKTIVLTGAFILGTEPNSDASFNLDFALASMNHLDKGVFIAMHGRVFNWNNVRKNVEQNRFETLSE